MRMSILKKGEFGSYFDIGTFLFGMVSWLYLSRLFFFVSFFFLFFLHLNGPLTDALSIIGEFESGWSHTKKNYIPWPTKTYPEDPLGPDEILEQKMLWPDTRVIPFHYPHPVTGKKIADDDLRAPGWGEDVATSEKPLTLELPKGQKRAGAVEGVTQSEPGTKILPELVQNKVANGA